MLLPFSQYLNSELGESGVVVGVVDFYDELEEIEGSCQSCLIAIDGQY